MKKDAYYFPHFSNARNDSKMIKLRRVLGIEGYGIYFMLLEVLREQTEFKLPLLGIEDLSYEWHVSKEKIMSVINDFDLFIINESYYFSPKLVLYLQPYIEKSERARLAARKRWDNANAYTKALPMQSDSNASKVKETKVKESKEKESEINNIYSVYPSYCKIRDRSTGKGQKDKDKIKKLLSSISEDKLIETIEWYIADCKKSNTYIKNFSTFLNNIPDITTESKPSQEPRKYTFTCSFENRFVSDLKAFDEQGAKDLYMRNNGIYPDKIIKL